MKNQKIANRATLFVVLVLSFSFLTLTVSTQKVMGQSNGTTTIQTWAFTGPVPSSPNFNLFAANAIQGMMNGGNTPVGDPNTPAYWAPITSGSIPAWSLISTPNYNSWNGNINPTGNFADEFGCRLNFGFSIRSSETFTFSQIHFIFSSPFSMFENTFGGLGVRYSQLDRGIWFGPDGNEGTADDVIYNTVGYENSPINLLISSGFSTTILSMNGLPEVSMPNTREAITIRGPYTINMEYSLQGAVGLRDINIEVPEPSTYFLGFIATILFLGYHRRRNR